jgi:hypothetical protein
VSRSDNTDDPAHSQSPSLFTPPSRLFSPIPVDHLLNSPEFIETDAMGPLDDIENARVTRSEPDSPLPSAPLLFSHLPGEGHTYSPEDNSFMSINISDPLSELTTHADSCSVELDRPPSSATSPDVRNTMTLLPAHLPQTQYHEHESITPFRDPERDSKNTAIDIPSPPPLQDDSYFAFEEPGVRRFRPRTAVQLRPYSVEDVRYKQQLRSNPEAIVKPSRHRSPGPRSGHPDDHYEPEETQKDIGPHMVESRLASASPSGVSVRQEIWAESMSDSDDDLDPQMHQLRREAKQIEREKRRIEKEKRMQEKKEKVARKLDVHDVKSKVRPNVRASPLLFSGVLSTTGRDFDVVSPAYASTWIRRQCRYG